MLCSLKLEHHNNYRNTSSDSSIHYILSDIFLKISFNIILHFEHKPLKL